MIGKYRNIAGLWIKRINEKTAGAKIDIQKLYDAVKKRYTDLGYDISGDRLLVSDQPTYANGKPVPRDVLKPNVSGGDAQDDGTIRINPNYRSVMRHWKIKGSGRDFLNTIIGHELGHHIDRTLLRGTSRSKQELRDRLLDEIRRKRFHTVYTDSYGPDTDPRKLDKELLAEYLSSIVNNKTVEKKAEARENLVKAAADYVLAKRRMNKQAQSIVFGGGPVSFPAYGNPTKESPVANDQTSNLRRMWSYIDAAKRTGYFDDISENEAAVRRLNEYPHDYASEKEIRSSRLLPDEVELVPSTGTPGESEYRITEYADGTRSHAIHAPTNAYGMYPKSIVSHEAGHYADLTNRIQRGTIDPSKSWVDQFTPPFTNRANPYRTTVTQAADPNYDDDMRDEQQAWDRAGNQYDPKIRELSMDTYRTAAEAIYRQRAGSALDEFIPFELENRSGGDTSPVSRKSIVRYSRGRLPHDIGKGPDPGMSIPRSTVENYFKNHTMDQAQDLIYEFIERDKKDQFRYKGP